MQLCTQSAQGTSGGLAWTLWSNGIGGCITTYGTDAFSANWSNTGDFMARAGLNFNPAMPYTSLGTITAQFEEKKTGTAGGSSNIGVYGWSVSPCVEWYIIDDAFGPLGSGTGLKGSAMIDGDSYFLSSSTVTGTRPSGSCPSASTWTVFTSIRAHARTCGQISIGQHFQAWNNVGMILGNLTEAKIVIEVFGGTGSIDFTTASVTAQ